MNTPFVFETDNEQFEPEMEGYAADNELEFEENDFEQEVRDHRRRTVGPVPARARTAVRPLPRAASRPAVRRSFVPRPSRGFGTGIRRPLRPATLFRTSSRPFRQPFRQPGTFFRGVPGTRFRFGPNRPFMQRPIGMRPGRPFRHWRHRRPNRPFLDGVNRFFPPAGGFGPQFDDGTVQPERLISMIQSLLNQLNGSNLPVDGAMNGATLDAISQVPDAAPPDNDPAQAMPPAGVAIAAPVVGAPEAAPTDEMESYFKETDFEDEFENFENEYANEEAEFTPEDISQLQMILSQALGTPIEPDGRMNFRTRRALRSYQMQSGLPGHGYFDGRTRRRLMSGPRRTSPGRFRRGGRRGPFFETELEFEDEKQKPVLVWGSMPLPASENGRFLSALAKLEKLIYSSGKHSDLRYICWLLKLRTPGTDDRVVRWSTICPGTSGAIGAAMLVGPCDITQGMPIKQATIESAFRTVDDVERKGQSVGIFTYVKSDIVVAVELTMDPLQSFRSLYDNVILATHKLHLWANNPMGGSSAMPKAYVSIKDWIGRKQRDKSSLNSC